MFNAECKEDIPSTIYLEVGCGRKLELDGGDDGDDDQHEGEAHHDAVLGGKTFHFSDDVNYLIICCTTQYIVHTHSTQYLCCAPFSSYREVVDLEIKG